jgi:hypothetical protein
MTEAQDPNNSNQLFMVKVMHMQYDIRYAVVIAAKYTVN